MLTPDIMLDAYGRGIFPMADGRDSPDLHWVEPRFRGVFPLGGFHISQSLRRRIRAGGHDIALNRDFADVVQGCAARNETWINAELHRVYSDLHAQGHAHSLEVYADGLLVGGVFGLTLGAAFFGESMFSRITDGSKIALAYLCDHLHSSGFRLFDTQFLTPHLATLGAIEIPRRAYLERLKAAVGQNAVFGAAPLPTAQELLHRTTQMS